MPFLLNVWREACRHIELGESITRLASLVSSRIPVDLVLVRRISIEESVIETVAIGQCGGVPIPRDARSEHSPEDLDGVKSWSKERVITQPPAGRHNPVVKALMPEDLRGRVLMGPLHTEGGALGVLIFVNQSQAEFTVEHEDVMQSLIEPFTVAFENHRRFIELARLREAVEAENKALLARLRRTEIVEEIVGAAGTLGRVMEQVDQVAPTNAPVLILGETGTGKEVIARAIHARSARRDGPIVRVNCGAIPPELIDSELFGHEKGSFTGAINVRRGWFERADGGTLFLDEIAELPAAAQVRLLRVLQDGSYERLGGQQTLTSDVRIIAATHRDMEGLMSSGQFREDLWYRISVFPIYLPPLRARKEDFPDLVSHFTRNAGIRLGGTPLEPTPEDMKLLESYPWPGNVRELSATIERAAILGGGRRLDLAGALGTKLHALSERIDALPAPFDDGADDLQTLDRAMANHIERALQRSGGRVEGPDGAAHLLDINPNTLRGRMRRLDINWRTFRDAET